MNQVVQTLDQHCYLTKLLGYDYNISYKHDKTNKLADTLSTKKSSATFQLQLLSNLLAVFLLFITPFHLQELHKEMKQANTCTRPSKSSIA